MKSRTIRPLRGTSLILLTLGLIGCNPYNSEFACKGAPFGTCATTPQIYQKIMEEKEKGSLDTEPGSFGATANGVGAVSAPPGSPGASGESVSLAEVKVANAAKVLPSTMSAYREAELQKVTKLLKQPVTPVVVPPKVMRILFLPYESEDGMLNMPEYAYIMLDRPKWSMGDYLTGHMGGR